MMRLTFSESLALSLLAAMALAEALLRVMP